MKLLSTLSILIASACVLNAQVVTYDIPFSQTTGLQQTTGDICSAPWTTEEAFQQTQGNTWGFTWTSTNGGVAQSVEITLGFTVTDGGGTFNTSLNGSASFQVSDGAAKACESSTLMTWSVDPTNYVSGGSNTFLVDFSTAANVSQVDNLPFLGDPFFRVTVDYSPCGETDSTLTVNGMTLTSNSSNASYQWMDCGTGMIIPGETGVSYTASTPGDYAVIVTDTSGQCTDTSACTTVGASGIINLQKSSLEIYPNPAQNTLIIDMPITGEITGYISDMQGRIVEVLALKGAEYSSQQVNISGLAKGQYHIVMQSSHTNYSARFIKE